MKPRILAFTFLLFLIIGCTSKKPPLMPDPIYNVIGPTAEDWKIEKNRLQNNPEFISFYKEKRIRILEFKPELKNAKREGKTDSIAVKSWNATVYDYTNDQNYLVSYPPIGGQLSISKNTLTPYPNEEELELAEITLRQFLKVKGRPDSLILISQAMPPVIRNEEGNRALTFFTTIIKENDRENGAYAVNMSVDPLAVWDISENFGGIEMTETTCGVPAQNGGSSSDGQILVTIPSPVPSIHPLWEFTVVQPSSSSGLAGSNHPFQGGSGVELLNVYYRGKLVFKSAHTPKLNVNYEEGCGGETTSYCGEGSMGYDDGIGQETGFIANGDLLAPGFMNCSMMPTTIVDNENDAGNFKGVAFFKNTSNNSFLITSELHFGYYRYVSEWTFYPDGRIVPRFKFHAVNNLCTCNRHIHHVYWRFDFDVNGTSNWVIESFGTQSSGLKPSNGGIAWQSYPTFTSEVTRYRTFPYMMWSVHGSDNKRVDLIAGPHDGDATDNIWAKGDVFVAKYYESQINEWSGGDYKVCFNEENLINGENIVEEDIVIWYRAESLHDEDIEDESEHQIVGPIIKNNWPLQIYTDEEEDQM